MAQPTAGLRIVSGKSLSANWFGTGSVRVEAPLCLSSSTGSYRLTVTPSSGIQSLAGSGEVQIGLSESSGRISLKPVTGVAALYFTGTVDPADSRCGDGPNAQLIIDLPERALMSASAGSYFDQLQLEIDAL